MTLLWQNVRFEGPTVPDLERIASAITSICGLAVRIEHPTEPSPLLDLEADLAFEAFPLNTLEISAYRPGAVRRDIEQTMPGDSDDARLYRRVMSRTVTGADETDKFRTVRLQIVMGQEPTLFCIAALALESLGGTLNSPFPPDLREEMLRPLTVEELHRRSRKAGWTAGIRTALILLFLPFSILWGILQALVTFPAQRRRTERWLQQELERDKAEHPPNE